MASNANQKSTDDSTAVDLLVGNTSSEGMGREQISTGHKTIASNLGKRKREAERRTDDSNSLTHSDLPPKLAPAPLESLKPPDEGPLIIVAVEMDKEIRELEFPLSFLPEGNPLLLAAVEDKPGRYYVEFVSKGLGHFYADYVSALYDGQLKYDSVAVSPDDHAKLLALYGFGRRMNDQLYQDHVMDALRLSLCQHKGDVFRLQVPTVQNINDLYARAPPGCPLRRMINDLCTCATIRTFLDVKQDSEPPNPEFVTHLATTLDKYVRQSPSNKAHRQMFREGRPWPYFHTIKGTAEELMRKEETAMQAVDAVYKYNISAWAA